MPDHLTFVINSTDEFSSFDLLVKSLEDIQRLLRDVDYAIYRRRPTEEWIVQNLKSSAPTITLTPKREDRQAVGVIGEGLRLVTEGTDQPPQHFTEPVFEDLKRMRRLFRGTGKARSMSVLMDDEKPATVCEDIASKADRVLSAGHHNLGSLQGKLEAINVHRSPTATIWDRVSGVPVRWAFPREEMDRVKALLEKSVLVTGDIRYFSNGAPRSISNVIAIEDAAPRQPLGKAGFGSIPDRQVQVMGAAEWLKCIREWDKSSHAGATAVVGYKRHHWLSCGGRGRC